MLYGIDISKMGLSRIEKGKRTVTDFELCGLSKVFNVSLEYLVSEFYNELNK